jgi:hypothetical protein
MTNQMRRDLEKRVKEKFDLWVRDSDDIYKLGGLGFNEFLCDVTFILLAFVTNIYSCTPLEEKEFLELCQDYFKVARANEKLEPLRSLWAENRA